MTNKNIEKQTTRTLRELTKTERRAVAGGADDSVIGGAGSNVS